MTCTCHTVYYIVCYNPIVNIQDMMAFITLLDMVGLVCTAVTLGVKLAQFLLARYFCIHSYMSIYWNHQRRYTNKSMMTFSVKHWFFSESSFWDFHILVYYTCIHMTYSVVQGVIVETIVDYHYSKSHDMYVHQGINWQSISFQ